MTEVNKNEWEFNMPGYAVVAKIEYDTELTLYEVDDNAEKLTEWDDNLNYDDSPGDTWTDAKSRRGNWDE